MITTPTNLDYLISFVRVRMGDIYSPPQYSEPFIRTALVNAIPSLSQKWTWRYFIYTTSLNRGGNLVETPAGIVELTPLPNEYDIVRNPAATFTMSPPPVVEQNDEAIIVLAATILLRRALIASSTAVFSNWSTPDFSYSNVASAKTMLEALASEQQELDDRLRVYATPKKRAI